MSRNSVHGDLIAIGAGVVVWGAVIPLVRVVARASVSPSPAVATGLLGLHVGIAYATTPILSSLLRWNTPADKVRGIALALGTANALDGVAHLVWPTLYSGDAKEQVAAAGNVFLAAGLLGVFSAYAK